MVAVLFTLARHVMPATHASADSNSLFIMFDIGFGVSPTGDESVIPAVDFFANLFLIPLYISPIHELL